MPRINPIDLQHADDRAAKLLESVRKSLGVTPNVMTTIAHSPAALEAYLGFGQALGAGKLSGRVREQIAVAVAGENSCGYCASAHTAIGKKLGVADDELSQNLRGEASDPRVNAALEFAQEIVRKRGFVSDDALAAVREAGYSDREIIEIIATVVINIFTNYVNHIAQTEIDFPEVKVDEPVAV